MSRPANDEMVQGFRDGYDLDAPKPSENRSASYCHGFANGRRDRGLLPPVGIDDLRRRAEVAMLMDECR